MKRDNLGRLIMGWNGTEKDRFFEKVSKASSCWLWTGAITPAGYGMFWANGKNIYAHRYSFSISNGSIPEDKEIDHLCRVRNCVNPKHLEAVTREINTRRGKAGEVLRHRQLSKTHCPRGHAYNETNTYHPPKYPERRDCRACRKIARRKYYGYYTRYKEVLNG